MRWVKLLCKDATVALVVHKVNRTTRASKHINVAVVVHIASGNLRCSKRGEGRRRGKKRGGKKRGG